MALERLAARKKWWLWSGAIAATTVLFFLVLAGIFQWYRMNLQPLRPTASEKIRLTIQQGETTTSIAKKLEQNGIVQSAVAVEWYIRLEHPGVRLQAGTYAISPSQSIPAIIDHLEKGKTDLFWVTIPPGNTLKQIKATLSKHGYTDGEIDTALRARYVTPLLADKPINASLEGYIYPETFEVQSDNTVQTLFQRSMDTLYQRLKDEGLLDAFKARGLTLHQALTLASIIQKEVSSEADEKQVAQVFYSRLAADMPLGADATFVYAAREQGVAPRVDLESPYNTRLHAGLPPGPISNMNLSALRAVASPAPGDYLYFVSGDDGNTYFAKDLATHEENIKKYCHKLCDLPQ